MDVGDLRQEYSRDGLSREDLASDPFSQFEHWFQQACDSVSADSSVRNVPEPNAMSLATVSAIGEPSQRMVLLKYFDRQGFVFFTNYESEKARQIEENSNVSLVLTTKHSDLFP